MVYIDYMKEVHTPVINILGDARMSMNCKQGVSSYQLTTDYAHNHVAIIRGSFTIKELESIIFAMQTETYSIPRLAQTSEKWSN